MIISLFQTFPWTCPQYVKPGADAWAMCAEVTSTSVDKDFDTTRRTPWIDMDDHKNIFNYNIDGRDINSEINLTSSNFANRHYKGAQTVVTLVKKDIHERSPEFFI